MVIVAIRIGAGSRPAVLAGARLAEQLGAELRMLYVAEELEAVKELAVAAGQTVEEARKRLLEDIEDSCRNELGDAYPGRGHLIVREGKVAEQVAQAAVDLGAQLIVCGMKGQSALAKFVLGDATGAILERAPCPVVVIPPAITHPKG